MECSIENLLPSKTPLEYPAPYTRAVSFAVGDADVIMPHSPATSCQCLPYPSSALYRVKLSRMSYAAAPIQEQRSMECSMECSIERCASTGIGVWLCAPRMSQLATSALFRHRRCRVYCVGIDLPVRRMTGSG